MKKFIPVFVAALAVAGFGGCKKVIDAIFPGIEADVPAITVTIPALQPFPGAPVPQGELRVGSYTQHFNLDSLVKAKTGGAFGAGDVTSVQLKQINFTVGNSDQQNNLSNFKSVRFTFSSSSRQDVADIGTINFPDSTITSYSWMPTNVPDLRPYLSGSELNYNVYGQLRRYTTRALNLTMNITLKAK